MARFAIGRSLAAICAVGAAASASAQDLTLNAATALGLATGPNPDTGIVLGPALVYPQLFLGAVYNDNIYGSPGLATAGWGLRVNPILSAIDDDGLHKTSLYFNADAELYPGANANSPSAQNNQLAIVASANHVWKPSEDLVLELTAGYNRNNSLFGMLSGNATAFVSSPTTANITGYQQYYDLATVSGSVEKKFPGGFSLRVGGGVQALTYEQAASQLAAPLSGVDYNAFVRAGYQLTPVVTGFVETDGDFRRYQNGWYDANGYRVIGGLSSDLISLFRGEIYAGYQRQVSAEGVFGPVASPTYGGRIFYYPTQYITVAASLDRAFGSAASETAPTTPSSPNTQTIEARLQADYALAEYWSASARAALAHETYSDSPLQAATYTLGVGVRYNFWRNIGLTLDYNYLQSKSNSAALPGYAQNIVSAGFNYRY